MVALGRSLGDFWKIFWEGLALSSQERHQETVGWTDRLSISTMSQWVLPTETLVACLLRQLTGDGCHICLRPFIPFWRSVGMTRFNRIQVCMPSSGLPMSVFFLLGLRLKNPLQLTKARMELI